MYQVNIHRNNTGCDIASVEPYEGVHKIVHQLDHLDSVTELNVFNGTKEECERWADNYNSL